MSKSTKRLLTIVLLSLIGITSQYVTTSAQELEGREGNMGGRGSSRTTRPPTFINPQNGERIEFAQFGGRGELTVAPAEGPAERPREMIALTVWVLTVNDSAAPESEELVGKLVDKVKNLPAVIGQTDDVRNLVGRLQVAGLLQKSREYRLVTLDGQSVTYQTGGNHPTIVGTNVNNRRRSNSFNFQQVGTVITATPHIDASSRIQLNLEYQASGIEKSKEAIIEPDGEQPIFADFTTSQQINTALRLKSGTAALVSSEATLDIAGNSTGGQTRLIIVGAAALPALEELQTTEKAEDSARPAVRSVEIELFQSAAPEN